MIPLSSSGVGVGKMGGSCPQVFLHLLGQILGHPDVALEILLQLEHQGLKVVDGGLEAVKPLCHNRNCRLLDQLAYGGGGHGLLALSSALS